MRQSWKKPEISVKLTDKEYWQLEYLSRISTRLGVLIFFLIVIPIILGFCTAIGLR